VVIANNCMVISIRKGCDWKYVLGDLATSFSLSFLLLHEIMTRSFRQCFRICVRTWFTLFYMIKICCSTWTATRYCFVIVYFKIRKVLDTNAFQYIHYMSEWLLFNVNSAIVQLYHVCSCIFNYLYENKISFLYILFCVFIITASVV
jgi:hypothetical protein